jgi:hypothetical protein
MMPAEMRLAQRKIRQISQTRRFFKQGPTFSAADAEGRNLIPTAEEILCQNG